MPLPYPKTEHLSIAVMMCAYVFHTQSLTQMDRLTYLLERCRVLTGVCHANVKLIDRYFGVQESSGSIQTKHSLGF